MILPLVVVSDLTIAALIILKRRACLKLDVQWSSVCNRDLVRILHRIYCRFMSVRRQILCWLCWIQTNLTRVMLLLCIILNRCGEYCTTPVRGQGLLRLPLRGAACWHLLRLASTTTVLSLVPYHHQWTTTTRWYSWRLALACHISLLL